MRIGQCLRIERALLLVSIISKLVHPLLGLVVYGCPARALIKPCTCNEITKGLELLCEGVHLETLREIFENVQQTRQTIVYLKMKNNYLETFPSYLLSSIQIRHLVAHSCNINLIDPSAFDGLKNEIESIDFSENKFSQIPQGLRGLSSLISLNLNFNQITSINENSFDGLVSLLRLSLFGNKIVSVHPQAFVGVGINLTRINIGGNQLITVPSNALNDLKSIQRLQFHENRIESLQRDDFSNLKKIENLDVLNFASNFLRKLENFVFSDLKAINSLDFESNQIKVIEEFAFYGVENSLEWLKLGENLIESIPTEALANLTKLRELDLRGNRIKVIHKQSFQSFGSNIKFLYLQKNKIETIEKSSFDSLTSLEWIYLNSNKLKQTPQNLFGRSLSSLWIIDLEDNPLKCGCDIVWYNQWYDKKSKNPVNSIAKEVGCDISSDHKRSTQRISVHHLNFEELKCGAVQRTFYLFTFSWTVTILIFIS